jgi:hypothetical protein
MKKYRVKEIQLKQDVFVGDCILEKGDTLLVTSPVTRKRQVEISAKCEADQDLIDRLTIEIFRLKAEKNGMISASDYKQAQIYIKILSYYWLLKMDDFIKGELQFLRENSAFLSPKEIRKRIA